jgi:hypothetical protein
MLSKPKSEAAARHAHVANSKRRPRIDNQRQPVVQEGGDGDGERWGSKYSSDLPSLKDETFDSIAQACAIVMREKERQEQGISAAQVNPVLPPLALAP